MYSAKEMEMMYVAGVLDSEGTIQSDVKKYTNKDGVQQEYFYISCRIAMKGKGRKVIERIREAMDGLGEIYEYKKMWTYHVHGNDAKEFLEKLEPYVYLKQDQLHTALEYFEDGANREAIYWKMRMLKQLSYK